jgi:F-type H+-transporting ATPase subunit delta
VRGEIVARTYASALFDLGARDGRLEEFGGALEDFARILVEVPELRLFLETPRIDRSEKKRVLRQSLEGKVPDSVLNFLLLVVDRRRQRLLGGMNEEYQALLDEHLGRAHVEVTVARPLSDEGLEEVRRELSRILGKEVIPHVRVNSDVLGGIVFRSGDTVYDGSVRRRLEQLKRRLLAADV